MFGSEILEVAIGLVLVYLLLALICSAISEWIARMFAMRSKTLRAGIRNLLDPSAGSNLANEIYGHPLVKGLYRKGRWDRLKAKLRGVSGNEGPSNISARTFVLALFDTIADAGESQEPASQANGDGDEGGSTERTAPRSSAKDPFEALVVGVEALRAPEDVKRVLRTILQSADAETDRWEDALVKARTSVEIWFDDAMDRVSGWYKRQTQLIVLGLALGVTLAMNADTFVIANSLWHDNAAREVVVAAAAGRAQQTVSEPLGGSREIPLSQVITMAAGGDVESIEVRGDKLTVRSTGGETFTSRKEAGSSVVETLEQSGVDPAASRLQVVVKSEAGSAPDLAELQAEIDQLPLPMGWVGEGRDDPRAAPSDAMGWVVKLLGIAFTAFAVALGAPFWFDLLNRFVNLRGSGATPLRTSGSTTSG